MALSTREIRELVTARQTGPSRDLADAVVALCDHVDDLEEKIAELEEGGR